MLFRIPENWDNERKFSTEDAEYTIQEVVEIMLKAKDYYGIGMFKCPNDLDFILKFSYYFNNDCCFPIRGYLSGGFVHVSNLPNTILKLYFEMPKSKHNKLKYATWFLIVNDYRDRQFSAIVLCDYFGIDKFSDIIDKFNDLQHDSTMEEIIKYCIDGNWFSTFDKIKILIAYTNRFKKIPDVIMDYLKDECSTSELHEKHFTNELLDYYNRHASSSLDHILSDYVSKYDKITIKKNIKSMLLAFRTLHEDLPNDGKEHYKVAKELINNILEHPGFDKYISSGY